MLSSVRMRIEMGLSLEDKWAIQDLVNRYCHYSDHGEWQKLRALFTDDVIMDVVGLDIVLRGPDEQVGDARRSFTRTRGKNRHYNHNLIIDETSSDEAWARYYIQQLVAQDTVGDTPLGVTLRMEDRVLRTVAGWRIAERRVICDYSYRLSDDEMADFATQGLA